MPPPDEDILAQLVDPVGSPLTYNAAICMPTMRACTQCDKGQRASAARPAVMASHGRISTDYI